MTTRDTADIFVPPWLPRALYNIWLDAFIDAGGTADATTSALIATETVRRAPQYDRAFPGIRRDDGSIRFPINPEQTYLGTIEGYENSLLSIDVNPNVFNLVQLIEGDVSVPEFTTRLESIYERVLESAGEIRAFYADNYARNLTTSAIVASVIDPDIGQAIIEQRLSVSEVGGEAAARGFGIDLGFAERLEQGGVSRAGAQELFGQAAIDLPIFDVLARRHSDPDDDFDLEEFTRAAVFDDPEQRRRIRRLISSERALFSGGLTPSLGLATFRTQPETGGFVGLTQR